MRVIRWWVWAASVTCRVVDIHDIVWLMCMVLGKAVVVSRRSSLPLEDPLYASRNSPSYDRLSSLQRLSERRNSRPISRLCCRSSTGTHMRQSALAPAPPCTCSPTHSAEASQISPRPDMVYRYDRRQKFKSHNCSVRCCIYIKIWKCMLTL